MDELRSQLNSICSVVPPSNKSQASSQSTGGAKKTITDKNGKTRTIVKYNSNKPRTSDPKPGEKKKQKKTTGRTATIASCVDGMLVTIKQIERAGLEWTITRKMQSLKILWAATLRILNSQF